MGIILILAAVAVLAMLGLAALSGLIGLGRLALVLLPQRHPPESHLPPVPAPRA